MKKLNKEFFILYEYKTNRYYDSAIGVDNLATILDKTRKQTVAALRNKNYILGKDKIKLMLLREDDLNDK